MNDFGIQIEDGSSVLPQFVVDENDKSLSLYNWQRRGIEYFFKYNKAIFEASTGCLTGDTLINMPRDRNKYPDGIPIKELVGKQNFYVYTYNINKKGIEVKKAKKVWLSHKNKDIYEIETSSGKKIRATKNHPFLVNIKEKLKSGCGRGAQPKIIEQKYIKLENLKRAMYLRMWPVNKYLCNSGKTGNGYSQIKSALGKRCMSEHRFIASQVLGDIIKKIVHHKNENGLDNRIENLEIKTIHEHNSYHTKKRGFYSRALWEKNGHPRGMKGKKHSEKTKEMIALNTRKALNNIEYKSFAIKDKLNVNEYQIFQKDWKDKCSIRSKKGLAKLTKKELSQRSTGRNKYSEFICSIKYIGKEDVYDMEVEENHNFIANGFVVHNSGKTVFAIEIIKRVLKIDPDIRILIVVPKNIILETVWFKELFDNGISLVDIGVFYGRIKELNKITITNMQSIDKLPYRVFDFVIFDEIHNFGTPRMLKYVKKDKKYKLGLSATVARMDMKHMDLLEAFDYKMFKYTPHEAIADGVINAFKFTNISVEMDSEKRVIYEKLSHELRMIIQQGGSYGAIMRTNEPLKFRMLKKMMERKQLVNNYWRKFDVVKLIAKRHLKNKIILFNEFNSQTNRCYWHLLDTGVKSCVIHSGVDRDKREANLIGFRQDKYNVLLTSKVLDEGYSLPKIDVGIIMAGNSTARQTIQRMGRVLRKKEHESDLYQIYVKDTIEEDYALQRSKLFKGLCSNYFDYQYNIKDEYIKWVDLDDKWVGLR